MLRSKINDFFSFPFVLNMNTYFRDYDAIPVVSEDQEELKNIPKMDFSEPAFRAPKKRTNRKDSFETKNDLPSKPEGPLFFNKDDDFFKTEFKNKFSNKTVEQ